MNASELKELLPLAAKAMGKPHKWISMLGGMYHIIDSGRADGPWNPAESPGDGAEMEDKLRISVTRTLTRVFTSAEDNDRNEYICIELYADHPTEGHARRWASLRVAAEIGRSMK